MFSTKGFPKYLKISIVYSAVWANKYVTLITIQLKYIIYQLHYVIHL